MKINVLDPDLSRFKLELVVVSVWLEFAINRKCCFSKLFSNRNGNGNQDRPWFKHCWNWFMEYLLQPDGYCHVLTNRGQKIRLLNNNLCSHSLHIFCMWIMFIFLQKECRCVLSIYLQMVGSIYPVTPVCSQSLFASLCPCWFSCQSKALTSPPSDRLSGTGWIHFYSQKNKLVSFHLDITATNDWSLEQSVCHCFFFLALCYHHRCRYKAAGCRQWRWVVIPAQPEECVECGWALAVSWLAWWRSSAGRSMGNCLELDSLAAGNKHANRYVHFVKYPDIPLDIWTSIWGASWKYKLVVFCDCFDMLW